MAELLPAISPIFVRRIYSIKHNQVGGVTQAAWCIVQWSRMTNQACRPSIMTMNVYPRSLQTALDDTKGGCLRSQIKTFEVQDGKNTEIVGAIKGGSGLLKQAVYSTAKTGPDISEMKPGDLNFWVEAQTVFSPLPMIRQVNLEELHSIWDYEGKLELKTWGVTLGKRVLEHRLRSPPAKIIRIFLSKAAETIVDEVMSARVEPLADKKVVGPMVGLTLEVPFASLEANADTRVTATQADDAEVDVSTLALPNETLQQARACEVLRRFAAKWWDYNLSRKAWKWWHENGKSGKDAAAIADCVRRNKACTYWEWVRWSTIHFWMFSEEIRNAF